MNLEEITLEKAMEKLWKKEDIPKIDTEMEVWKIIEALGGMTWRMNHDAADGRISLSEGDLTFMDAARIVQQKLVEKLENEYGVIPPEKVPKRFDDNWSRIEIPSAPKGKIYYWDWYESMKKECFTEEWKNMICSGCPLHEKEPIEALSRHIPCNVFPGMMYQLISPSECGMVDKTFSGSWTEEQLFEKIKEVGGENSVKRFKQHQLNLRKK